MERIAHFDNLHEAFLRAVRGKNDRYEAQLFRHHLDENIESMGRELREDSYRFGAYRRFEVFDRKKRLICAAPFRDRVAMHAMMRICHPVFDGYQIYDSYASRLGKGTYSALDRARRYARRYKWYAKLDVCKCFDSISHEKLFGLLCSLFKDRQLLGYFHQLIEGYSTRPGRGVPIGNLTSQYFVNHYLGVADHYLKEVVKAPAMVRYMDDVVLFFNDRSFLGEAVTRYHAFLSDSLLLESHDPVMNYTRCGVPFLGYVVFPDYLHLSTASRHRFRRKLYSISEQFAQGKICEADCRTRFASLYSFADKADSVAFRRKVYQEQGAFP